MSALAADPTMVRMDDRFRVLLRRGSVAVLGLLAALGDALWPNAGGGLVPPEPEGPPPDHPEAPRPGAGLTWAEERAWREFLDKG